MTVDRAALARTVALVVGPLLFACVTTVPSYDPYPPELRLEVRGLGGGSLVLRPGSGPAERELASGEEIHLSVVAADGGGVRRVALLGRMTVGCHNPETGARTSDSSDVIHEDLAREGPGATVRTTASVARVIRVSDYTLRCADPGARRWVEGTFQGEAEDFHGRWSRTASFTFWFEPAS